MEPMTSPDLGAAAERRIECMRKKTVRRAWNVRLVYTG
jgi:hypothetical protein